MGDNNFYKVFITLGGALLVAGVALYFLGTDGLDSRERLLTYLYGWLFWACLTFGCFGLSLLHHMAKGHWGYPVMRLLEAGGGPLMLLVTFVLFLPILVNVETVYPWVGMSVEEIGPKAEWYLTTKFWQVRTVAYFAIFIFMSYRNRMWQRKLDDTGDRKYLRWITNWSSGFFPVYFLLMNFAITDWAQSLLPHWFSTMYGIWFIVMQALGAIALVAIIVGWQGKKPPFDKVVTPGLTKDIGNLMLVLTMLWAYFSFSQYLIIYSGDLPEQTQYFITRTNGGFEYLGPVLIAFGFFVPFLMLISPRMKREPRLLMVAGLWLFGVRFLDMHYGVAPLWETGVLDGLVGKFGALAMFGGVWFYLFGRGLTSAPLFVKDQPHLKEASDHA